MSQSKPEPWSVIAQNLPEHADNPIHTDAGARAAGFSHALVAGVTTYAYLTHPVVAAWGVGWLAGGGGEVRFRSPVLDHDVLTLRPEADPGPDGAAVRVDVTAAREPDRVLASFRAVPVVGPPEELRDGEILPVLTTRIDEEFGLHYARRAGDDLGLYAELDVVHPVVWPSLANRVTHRHVARGAWIHVRSIVRHHALVPVGAEVTVRGVVVRRYQRSGERAVLDVIVEHDGRVAVSIEHEAIVALPDVA